MQLDLQPQKRNGDGNCPGLRCTRQGQHRICLTLTCTAHSPAQTTHSLLGPRSLQTVPIRWQQQLVQTRSSIRIQWTESSNRISIKLLFCSRRRPTKQTIHVLVVTTGSASGSLLRDSWLSVPFSSAGCDVALSTAIFEVESVTAPQSARTIDTEQEGCQDKMTAHHFCIPPAA